MLEDIKSYHLDDLKKLGMLNQFLTEIGNLDTNTTTTIFIFSSPQTIVDNELARTTLTKIAENGLLRVIAYDEIHLFEEFGRSFRPEFHKLGMFLKTINREAICEILMTATCTTKIKTSVESMIGVKVQLTAWADEIEMKFRKVKVSVKNTSRQM